MAVPTRIPETFAALFPDDLLELVLNQISTSLNVSIKAVDCDRWTLIGVGREDEVHCECPFRDRFSFAEATAACQSYDKTVGRQLLGEQQTQERVAISPAFQYCCSEGFIKVATLIRVNGRAALLTAGPFRPLGQTASEAEIGCQQDLPVVPDGLGDRLVAEAHRIQHIAQDYYTIRRSNVEALVSQEVSEVIGSIMASPKTEVWTQSKVALEALRKAMDASFAAFFAGEYEEDSVLRLRAWVGQLRRDPGMTDYPHFNWRKAGLKVDVSDTRGALVWFQTRCADWEQLTKGFRGGGVKEATLPVSKSDWLVPVQLPSGPRGLLVLGAPGASVADDEDFVFALCRDLGTRILSWQLSDILKQQRADWEKTSKMTGHRIRTSIKNFQAQIWTMAAVLAGKPGFTQADYQEANTDLEGAFRELREISYATESSIPCASDVRIVRREIMPVSAIVSAAIEDQEELAREHGIEIDADYDRLSLLPLVDVNPILMRYVFINLVNNGLKYSYPNPKDRKRILRVHPARFLDQDEVRVEIVNFGLGIKEEDRERIFQWGERLATGIPRFRSRYGQGIGLWECQHTVKGHGGKILVDSVTYDGQQVTDENIERCVTVFTVCLPRARAKNEGD